MLAQCCTFYTFHSDSLPCTPIPLLLGSMEPTIIVMSNLKNVLSLFDKVRDQYVKRSKESMLVYLHIGVYSNLDRKK